jgi:serine/threonine protein kinase
MDGYEKIRVVGRGGHASALLCKRKRDSFLVVIKEVFYDNYTESEKESLINEIRLLSMMKHPNIISYLESFRISERDSEMPHDSVPVEKLLIIMEFADGGNLLDYIQKQKTFLAESDIWDIFVQILLAVHHMHNKGIMHRDLKVSTFD